MTTQQAMQRVEEQEAADAVNEASTEQIKIVERKPVHLINTFARKQRDLLDQALTGLVNLEAKRNDVEGQIDRSYGADIEKLEANRTRVLEMMRAIETDLLSLKAERREKKVANQTEYELNKAAQQKIVDSLRVLVTSLES